MDFGTTLSYVAFYLVSLAVAYYYFTTRNKERMALIEAGANPDMFNSTEKYYILFVIGLVAVGIALGLISGAMVSTVIDIPNKSIIYMSCILLFGGASILAAFFIILRWIKKEQ